MVSPIIAASLLASLVCASVLPLDDAQVLYGARSKSTRDPLSPRGIERRSDHSKTFDLGWQVQDQALFSASDSLEPPPPGYTDKSVQQLDWRYRLHPDRWPSSHRSVGHREFLPLSRMQRLPHIRQHPRRLQRRCRPQYELDIQQRRCAYGLWCLCQSKGDLHHRLGEVLRQEACRTECM